MPNEKSSEITFEECLGFARGWRIASYWKSDIDICLEAQARLSQMSRLPREELSVEEAYFVDRYLKPLEEYMQ